MPAKRFRDRREAERQAFQNLCGKRFGRLTALYPTDQSRNRSRVWHCACDCGGSTEATARDLNRGSVRSCGCLRHRPPEPAHTIKANLHFVDGTCVENLIASQKRPVTGRTGVRGVCFSRNGRAYVATIGFKGKRHYLGQFPTLQEARAARLAAEERMYGAFLRTWNGSETRL